ncbi:MAG: hypothetical protein K2J31_02820 [Alistipes sp.]|nr:hypothetical protein [Alistipes sp.]
MKSTAIISAGLLSLAMASCCNNGEEAPAAQRVQFHIEASAGNTRTQWGESDTDGYHMQWCEDDRLKIIISTADNIAEASIGYISDDRSSASFDVDMELASTPDEYRLYACCPASAFDGITTDRDNPQQAPQLDFTVPQHQRPTSQSFDSDAAVIFGCSASDITPTSFVAMQFTSIVAYGKITVRDLPLDDCERVTSITLAASRPISGKATYRFDDDTPHSEAAQSASDTIEIEYSTADATFSAWFTTIPASLRDGVLCVCVKTDRGRYEKMIDLSGKDFVFEQNRILSFTVDMSSAARSEHPVWHRISSPEMISDRPHIIICNGFCCSNTLSFDGHTQALSLSDTNIAIDGNCIYNMVGDSLKGNFTTSITVETVISQYGNPDIWLYAANTNNGIYADNNAARRFRWIFSIADGAMRASCRNSSDTRYLGIASAGWRSYTSYNNVNYISTAIELFGLYVE